MTVDEILASGRYTDKQGRRWDYVETVTSWCSPEIDDEGVSWGCRYLDTAQMRMLIERDQHECVGLWACETHPVPHVVTGWTKQFWVSPGHSAFSRGPYGTLPAAMSAARTLAVGE